nr:hypothetical protein CFP56_46209 [Quercus suber]
MFFGKEHEGQEELAATPTNRRRRQTISRYDFVFFKRIEVAKAAKDTLQGVDLHGHPIKSESDSEVGTGSGGAKAEEKELGSKIECQEPGLSSSSNS